MSVSEKKAKYSVEEYLVLELSAATKTEYYDGELYAMSGGTRNHSLIATNLNGELRSALLGKGCFVFGSDLKVRIETTNSFVYPDGMVICGQEEYFFGKSDTILNPTLLFEVLSESTAAWDRGGKFRLYDEISSLKEYIVLEQHTPQIDMYHRNDQGFWVLKRYDGLDAEVEFKSLGVSIPTNLIFYGVEFE
jgi:Uma2 family endonuclease